MHHKSFSSKDTGHWAPNEFGKNNLYSKYKILLNISIYIIVFISVFTIVCVLFTLHATSLVYGVFLENRTALVPFLVFQVRDDSISIFTKNLLGKEDKFVAGKASLEIIRL